MNKIIDYSVYILFGILSIVFLYIGLSFINKNNIISLIILSTGILMLIITFSFIKKNEQISKILGER